MPPTVPSKVNWQVLSELNSQKTMKKYLVSGTRWDRCTRRSLKAGGYIQVFLVLKLNSDLRYVFIKVKVNLNDCHIN